MIIRENKFAKTTLASMSEQCFCFWCNGWKMARRKNTDCETCHNEMERPCRANSHGKSFVKEKRTPKRNP